MNPLSVVEGKKKRLVSDISHVNKFLFIPKFHYEDLSSLSQVFAKDDWLFNWDLKSGYHHVNDLYTTSAIFRVQLGHRWGAMLFLFLEFCLSGLPLHVSVLPSSRDRLHLGGDLWDNCFIYIDDDISGHRTKQLACIASHKQKSDLTRAGFIFSEKCNWEHPIR